MMNLPQRLTWFIFSCREVETEQKIKEFQSYKFYAELEKNFRTGCWGNLART